MEELINQIRRIYMLSEDTLLSMEGFLKKEFIKKNTCLLIEGQICNRLWFIEKGFVRIYYLNDGVDKTMWFLKDKDFLISVYSFFTHQPSYEYIETIEDCNLISISYSDLQHLYKKHTDFNIVGRVITERYYMLSEQRSVLLRTTTVEERLHTLLNVHPNIFSKVSARYIASYIGCQPETLSRIRKRKNI